MFVTYSILILLLPAVNFLFCSLLGRYIGQRGIKFITLLNFFVITFLSYYLFFITTKYSFSIYLNFGNWFSSAILCVDWEFCFDVLTCSMLLIIVLISTLVHIYSFDYMNSDPHFNRFISYLSLFTFFMILLVSSANLMCLFVGWEGVGICSYLLINFWFTRLQANKSAIKALLMNRIGDCGVLFGLLILVNVYETVDISILSLLVPQTVLFQINFLGYNCSILDIVASGFFLGTIGKSAQLGLHTWLPSAMEGPTPVSALIHAATMVTAGIFLIIRNSFIFEYSQILTFVVFWGSLTALFAALLALVQHDLKKIIAYSTCSQLGYMTMACGASNYLGSLYHLVNHAFFKALLFLSAGVIIHFLNNEQDLRRMGNLRNFLPFTYSVMFIATLAITGFPFLSGFYSKDVIIENLYLHTSFWFNFAFWISSITALITSYYSWRLVYLVFFSDSSALRINYKFNSTCELSTYTFVPLFILSFGSIFAGYLLSDIFINLDTGILLNDIFVLPQNVILTDAEFLPFYIKIVPTFFSFSGFFIFLFFKKSFFLLTEFKYKFNFIYNYLLQHGFFDLLYNKISLMILHVSYHDIFVIVDRGVLEKLGPSGIDNFYQRCILIFFRYFHPSIEYYLVILFYFYFLLFFI